MGHFSAVGFWAFALCLVVCLFATATECSNGEQEDVITKAIAQQAVDAAKTSTKKACENAQNYSDRAKGILEKVEAFKKEVEKTNSIAQGTAQENNDAKALVKDIKTISDSVNTLHQDAKTKLEKTIDSLGKWLSAAQTLDRECNKEIVANDGSTENYSNANTKALSTKSNADDLDNNINGVLTILDEAQSTAVTMERNSKEAQLKSSQVSVIVAVAKIDTMVGQAEGILTNTQTQRDAVNEIVQAMTKHCTNELIDSHAIIKEQCQRSNNELAKATDALGKAQQAEAAIKQQKGLADLALINVQKTETDVSKAQQEANKANTCVTTAEEIVPQLQSALETAKSSLTNTNDSKEKIDASLSTATSEKRPVQSGINTQVKTLQGSVSAAVSEIQTIMDNADITLRKTKKHKEDVNAIVEEMKKLCTTDLTESNEIIQALYKSANAELTNATDALQNATKAIAAMKEQKRIADAALTKVEAANEVNKTQHEVNAATGCVAKVKEIVLQLQSALQTAANSVTNAKVLQQKLVLALSTTTSEPITKEVKQTAKSDISVAEGTWPDQKDTKLQQMITNTEQPTSKDSLGQSDNTADKVKDALSTGVQNVPPTALTGEKAPAPGANNDSAMTVSVPLLVALIASAVLQ